MISREFLRSQFKSFAKSIQNTKKFLPKNGVKLTDLSVDLQTKFSKDSLGNAVNLLEKNVAIQSVKKFLPKNGIHLTNPSIKFQLKFTGDLLKNSVNLLKRRVGRSIAAGLVLNLDADVADEIKRDAENLQGADFGVGDNIISSATQQTVSQILPETTSFDYAEASTAAAPPTLDVAPPTPVISEAIPEPPPIPDVPIVEEIVEQLNALGQPTFSSLGLGGYSPVGLIQNLFEYFNVVIGIPWWETIFIGTVIIRLCMFPLVVIAQRNAAKMNNNLPQLQVIQMKLSDARQSGNQLEAARYTQEMMMFMKEKEISPFKNMLVPLAQMPVFLSFFMALRQMSNLPVESLKTGGLWWFTDLTVPDQFFIMPVVTSLTLWATIELGTDSAKLTSSNMQTMKYVLRALPIAVLPFTVNFPGAVLVYWTASNFVSLAQVGFLRIPSVREYFKIEKQIHINPESLPVKPKGFSEGLKESWSNMKVVKEMEERRRLDEIQFRRAGKGPIVKTYKYDPTKATTATPISAKKR